MIQTPFNSRSRIIRYPILASVWKQLAVPVISSLTFLVAATAARAEVIPFESLGYDQSVILRGVNPELNVGVPYPSGGVNPQNSFVRLRLEPSPRLNPDSTVRLLINGEIEQVVAVRTLLENPIVTVPLRELPRETRFINLAIQPYLYISRNYCQDLPTGNLFLTVGDDSFFQINPLRADQSVLGFFRPFYSQVVLNVPSNLNEQQAAAALALYSTLSYQFRDRKTPILWRQGSAPPAGSPATGNANPPGATTAQVFLRTGETTPDLQRNGSTLEVRADQKAVEALMDLTKDPGLVSQGLSVEEIEQLEEQTLPLSRSFNVLGFRDGARRYFGTQTIDVPFSLAQLGGRPNDFVANLRATWTPVNQDLKERLTAQVYLNDTLVETYNLSDTTKLDETLVLPAAQLNSNNNLSVVTAYVPAEGNCLVSPTEMTFQLHGDSYFSWTGYQEPVGNFSDLPFLFSRRAGQVVADISQPNALAAAAYLVGAVTRLSRQPLMPQLVDARQVQNWEDLPREGDLPTWRVIVSPPEQTSLPAPVRLQDGFQIYNPTNQQRLLTVDPTEPLGILQYFSYQDKPTLWLSWWGGQPQTATRLAASLADPRTLISAQLDGNVATYTDSTGIQSWDLRRRTLQVDYPDEFKLPVFLRRYRVPLIFLGLLVGGGIAWLVYRRLGQRPTPPAADSGPGPGEG
jgi:cellulose synthase operon protein B